MIKFFITLLGLSILVIVHELGHYLFAKMFNVGVEVFSVGMGPILYSFDDKKGTKWQFCLIPVGGYVQLKDKLNESNQHVNGGSFEECGSIATILIAFAGPLFNFLFSFLLFFAICLSIGIPNETSIIKEVTYNSVAHQAQLLKGDVVTKINTIDSKTLELSVLRDKKLIKKTLIKNSKKTPYGLSFQKNYSKKGVWESFMQSMKYVLKVIYKFISEIYKSFIFLSFPSNASGPLGIFQASMMQQTDLISFLLFIINVSISLGATNLLPIPILDGGQIVGAILYLMFHNFLSKKIMFYFQKIFLYFSIFFLSMVFSISLINDLEIYSYFDKQILQRINK